MTKEEIQNKQNALALKRVIGFVNHTIDKYEFIDNGFDNGVVAVFTSLKRLIESSFKEVEDEAKQK